MGWNHEDQKRIIVALDYSDTAQAYELVSQLNPESCRLKVGKELFTRGGPELVRMIVRDGFDVFLDLKFHDIPVTVARACQAAADLGVWMINVHSLGGRRMMEAAREAVEGVKNPPLLVAVTILTSMDESDLEEVGLPGEAEKNVLRLASVVKESGLDGVVCSPKEASSVREQIGEEFLLVTPGVRPFGSSANDQRRIMTPSDAIDAGANYLVIGRPITGVASPAQAIETINKEILCH
ncbi:MAG: orotidine-5'-phosphate decarboxylase [Gammaproteobacteria bacterium]